MGGSHSDSSHPDYGQGSFWLRTSRQLDDRNWNVLSYELGDALEAEGKEIEALKAIRMGCERDDHVAALKYAYILMLNNMRQKWVRKLINRHMDVYSHEYEVWVEWASLLALSHLRYGFLDQAQEILEEHLIP